MKPFKRLQKLLTGKDNRQVQVRLVKAEIDGQEARTEGLGERDAVTQIADSQITLSSLRKIREPDDATQIELGEDETTFKVVRNASGHTEVLYYEILPDQNDSAKQLENTEAGIITRADQSYQPYVEANPTQNPAPELVTGEEAARTPQADPVQPADDLVKNDPDALSHPAVQRGVPQPGTEPAGKGGEDHGVMRSNKNQQTNKK